MKLARYKAALRTVTDRSGSISIASGLLLPVMLAAAAIAVDMGQAYLERRTAQAVVDLAALNAANNLDRAEEAARATLSANKFEDVDSLTVIKGHYSADKALPVKDRFKAGAQPFNAVQVAMSKSVRLHFAATFMRLPLRLSVAAIAQDTAQASFSVGSRLAAVRDGLMNQVLGGMLGKNVTLTAMDYQALANANVRVDGLLRGIDASADLRAITFEDVLNSNVKLFDVLRATAATVSPDDHAASIALSSLAGGIQSNLQLPVAALFNISALGSAKIGSEKPALSGTVAILDVINAAVLAANGNRQLSFQLNLGIPGISRLSATVLVGERPVHSSWLSVGAAGSTVTTAQTRLKLIAEIAGSGALAGSTIRLPLYADIAYARATLDDVTCSASNDGVAKIGVLTGVGRVAITDLTDAELASPPTSFPAGQLVSTSLISVTAGAEAAVHNSDPIELAFDADDVENGLVKRVSTGSLTESVVTTLLGSATIKIKALGLGAPLVTKSTLLQSLAPAAQSLDGIVFEFLQTLGAAVGEADVAVQGIRCGNSTLAG